MYLHNRKEPITDLLTLGGEWEKYFYDIDEMSDDDLHEYLEEDSFYIEGAIHFTRYGRNILSFMDWDLVDQLFSYFAQAFEKLLFEGEQSTYFMFPDQPLRVDISYLKRKFTITVGSGKSYEISKRGIAEFLQKGKEFISRIEAYKKVPSEQSELILFDKLISKLYE